MPNAKFAFLELSAGKQPGMAVGLGLLRQQPDVIDAISIYINHIDTTRNEDYKREQCGTCWCG